MFSFINDLSESRLFPSRTSTDRYTHKEIQEFVQIYLCVFRIMLVERSSQDWIKTYIKKSIHWGDFSKWRSDGNDFYVLMHLLITTDTGLSSVFINSIMKWLRLAATTSGRYEMEVKRVLVRMDNDLRIRDSSLKNIRRLVTDWSDLSKREQRLAMTRLLQHMRAKMPKSEVLPHLVELSNHRGLEIKGACNLETDDRCKSDATISFTPYGFLSGLSEDATAGSTSAASVAAVPGALGVGFDPNGDTGIYPKKAKNKPIVLKR